MSDVDMPFEVFDIVLSDNPKMPFAVSVPVTVRRSYVGVFFDKENCRKCCDALNRSVKRIVRSWHLREYENAKLDEPVSFNSIRASATVEVDKTD